MSSQPGSRGFVRRRARAPAGGTRLTVVESGCDKIPADRFSRQWDDALDRLKRFVEG